MRCGRMTCDGHHFRAHLIDVHLTVTVVGQLAVQQIQRTFGRNDASFDVNTIVPFLVLTFLVDDMDLCVMNRNLIFFDNNL